MVKTIKAKLKELEGQHGIRILYACESGSRAWGFVSPDSDFDVRFIYAGRVNDYLNITEPEDVLNLPVDEVLDIGGWDIKKTLKLFAKSNSALYEWLQSPLIYKDDSGFAEELRQLMPKYYSLKAGGNHYLSMAYNAITGDLQGENVKLKRYFYALRAALACKWIVEQQTVPPMEFGKLRLLVDDENFQLSVDELLVKKSVSDEKTLGQHVALLDDWLSNTILTCKILLPKILTNQQPPDELNTIFRKYLLK